MSKEATMTISIDLPVGPLMPGFHRQHVGLQLSLQEAQTLAAIMAGLVSRDCMLDPGVPGATARHINAGSGADAIRWLLQQAREQMLAAAGS